MADTLERLYGPALLGAAAATLYTVPAATTTVLRYIRFLNTVSVDRTVTLSIGADTLGGRIFSTATIPGLGGYLDWSGSIPLVAGEIIQGFASVGAAVNVILVGVEQA